MAASIFVLARKYGVDAKIIRHIAKNVTRINLFSDKSKIEKKRTKISETSV